MNLDANTYTFEYQCWLSELKVFKVHTYRYMPGKLKVSHKQTETHLYMYSQKAAFQHISTMVWFWMQAANASAEGGRLALST